MTATQAPGMDLYPSRSRIAISTQSSPDAVQACAHIDPVVLPSARPEENDDFVLDFAARWVHFGGGSAEDIFIAFGWNEARYFERLRYLATRRFVAIDDFLRQRLLAVCAERLPPVSTPVTIPDERPRRCQ
ncbi:hypothetical protein [Rhodococcus sp. T7]|uniref:hypothetical protein n=1 Tax=Rhodococcus sp. T7 TaxID=627444 RepID=UPI0013CC058D|nr:hypothetical protein [Rhodococcus sp. T7]KAF0956918.1 hypothetical protein MLGJGCBP_09998 [Rhodococcus sp. T7]KAF0958686.1 hypothetical protein MLGJGCBP_08258 [Rhodococcus sp. T7]